MPTANFKQDLNYHPFVEKTLSSSSAESFEYHVDDEMGDTLYNMNKQFKYDDDKSFDSSFH